MACWWAMPRTVQADGRRRTALGSLVLIAPAVDLGRRWRLGVGAPAQTCSCNNVAKGELCAIADGCVGRSRG